LAVAAAGLAAILTPAAARATATATKSGSPAFKVSIAPAYATRGYPTTFEVKVTNTSGATLHSLNLKPPGGFSLLRPNANNPLRPRTQVRNHTFSFHNITVKPGGTMPIAVAVTPTVHDRCGATLRWSTSAYEGATGSGPQLALKTVSSHIRIRVLCPQTAACGDGGPECSTDRGTNVSRYGVVDDATSGNLLETVDVGRELTCAGYTRRDPNWYESLLSGATTSPAGAVPFEDTVTYTINGATSNGIGFCLGVPYDFATASGGEAPAGTLPNGKPGFIGLLAPCTTTTPPCIANVAQSNYPKVATTLTITIPELGDPWGGG
jgi:hypothetical protein